MFDSSKKKIIVEYEHKSLSLDEFDKTVNGILVDWKMNETQTNVNTTPLNINKPQTEQSELPWTNYVSELNEEGCDKENTNKLKYETLIGNGMILQQQEMQKNTSLDKSKDKEAIDINILHQGSINYENTKNQQLTNSNPWSSFLQNENKDTLESNENNSNNNDFMSYSEMMKMLTSDYYNQNNEKNIESNTITSVIDKGKKDENNKNITEQHKLIDEIINTSNNSNKFIKKDEVIEGDIDYNLKIDIEKTKTILETDIKARITNDERCQIPFKIKCKAKIAQILPIRKTIKVVPTVSGSIDSMLNTKGSININTCIKKEVEDFFLQKKPRNKSNRSNFYNYEDYRGEIEVQINNKIEKDFNPISSALWKHVDKRILNKSQKSDSNYSMTLIDEENPKEITNSETVLNDSKFTTKLYKTLQSENSLQTKLKIYNKEDSINPEFTLSASTSIKTKSESKMITKAAEIKAAMSKRFKNNIYTEIGLALQTNPDKQKGNKWIKGIYAKIAYD